MGLNRNKNLELVLDKYKNDKNFLKPLVEDYSLIKKGLKKNILCCCHLTMPHDESQKFIIMGDEVARKTPIFNF